MVANVKWLGCALFRVFCSKKKREGKKMPVIKFQHVCSSSSEDPVST